MNKNKIFAVVIALVVLLAGVLIVRSCKAKSTAKKEKVATALSLQEAPRPLEMELVKAVAVSEARSYPAVVCASRETALSFRVGGPLTEVTVEQGKTVKQGDLLMQIDPRDFKDRILSLEASLAAAHAHQVKAQLDFKRSEQLLGEEVIAQSQFDRDKSTQEASDAQVLSIQAQLELARHALADTSLRAPYDGTVTAQLVENHEMVSPGRVVLRYHNIQQLEVTIHVSESEIAKHALNGSAPAMISFPVLLGKQLQATLLEWSSEADKTTRTYAVTFTFAAPDDFTILPGMSALVNWNQPGNGQTLITVPLSALCADGADASVVWVFDDATGEAEQRHVELGALSGSARVAVLSGLSEGDRVIVSGSRLIHAHQIIEAKVR